MTDFHSDKLEMWQAAIRSALGPLAAFITPENFGLSAVQLVSQHADESDEFSRQIQARVDLGRAFAAVGLCEAVGDRIPEQYRHTVYYCEDRIDGALSVPRLIRERAAGRFSRIPVLRAARFVDTPEALLVSEVLRLSMRVAALWASAGGAEGHLANELTARIISLQRQQPWAALQSRPRPSLRALAATVKSRTVSGWNMPGDPVDRLADLFISAAESVADAAGPISFLLSRDERFEDRLFELVCLGWLIGALKRWCSMGSVHPESLRGRGPIFVGERNGVSARLYYQAGHIGKAARYRWRHSNKTVRAIPDFSLELEGEGGGINVLLDAKNRVVSSDSEVIYKLLGYRENIGAKPYRAVGIAPAFENTPGLKVASYEDRVAAIVRLPLASGHRLLNRAIPIWLRRVEAPAFRESTKTL